MEKQREREVEHKKCAHSEKFIMATPVCTSFKFNEFFLFGLEIYATL